MPLPSFLQRFFQGAAGRRPGAEPVSVSAADVEAVRVRARRRLIGMAVLVGAGVIGFPWLFETKPRPMAMDIEVVQRGASAAVVSTAAPKPGVQAQVKSVQESHPDEQEEVLDDKPVTKPAAHTAAASKAPESRVAEGKKPVESSKDAKDSKESKDKDAAKDKAAKDGKDKDAKPATKVATAGDKPASAAAVRYVIQIGAFSDQPTAREARMKAERAGLKTYTQVIGTDANRKIRVRLGPFEDKAAADKAMAALRKAGLTGSVLTL